MSLTVHRIAEIRRGTRKGREYGEMSMAEWNELLTLAQNALRMHAALNKAIGELRRFADEVDQDTDEFAKRADESLRELANTLSRLAEAQR